ncbi:hypothetical protein ACFQH6_09720 [Halobacteriaceae archaeon GCM10025711]
MNTLAGMASGLGAIILGASFLRLARSDSSERLYLVALEYGFALALFVAGLGFIFVSALDSVLA